MTRSFIKDFSSFLEKNNFSNSKIDTTKRGADLCTFGVGGEIPILFYPENDDCLGQSLVFFKEQGMPYRILGNGSNIVMPDSGLKEIIIKLPPLIFMGPSFKDIDKEEINSLEHGNSLKFNISASSSLMSLSRQFTDVGLSGLEFAAGIPGSLGGAVFMNAGAHGAEISEVIDFIKVLDQNGVEKIYKKNDLGFSYRKSKINSGEIITNVSLILKKDEISKIKAHRKECLEYRKKTQPLTFPSAGSVFKNISKEISAAKVIDDLGLKGFRMGAASISMLHANWIIVDEVGGKSQEIQNLVEVIIDKVYRNIGINLEPEIIFW